MPRTNDSQSPLKHGVVEAFIRAKIISGGWSIGSRLPTQNELLAEFGISKTTMQRAMDGLSADGFIETRGNLGTFVANHPPHLSHYGLIFFGTPGQEENWGRLWQNLSASADAI